MYRNLQALQAALRESRHEADDDERQTDDRNLTAALASVNSAILITTGPYEDLSRVATRSNALMMWYFGQVVPETVVGITGGEVQVLTLFKCFKFLKPLYETAKAAGCKINLRIRLEEQSKNDVFENFYSLI